MSERLKGCGATICPGPAHSSNTSPVSAGHPRFKQALPQQWSLCRQLRSSANSVTMHKFARLTRAARSEQILERVANAHLLEHTPSHFLLQALERLHDAVLAWLQHTAPCQPAPVCRCRIHSRVTASNSHTCSSQTFCWSLPVCHEPCMHWLLAYHLTWLTD